MDNYKLIVVGGGASGLMAAGLAAEKGLSVLVLDKMNQAGRKLSITGKGRCNLTNNSEIDEFISQVQPDGRFLFSALSRFTHDDLLELLERIGIQSKLERGGRFFPENDSAPDVTKKLIAWCRSHNVKFIQNFKVNKLLVMRDKITGVQGVYLNKEVQQIESFQANKVLIATGGLSYPATGSDGDGYKMLKNLGHTVSHCLPSLVPLEIDKNLTHTLNGLELKNVKVDVLDSGKVIESEFGEMSFIKTGISGPIILTLSRTIVPMLKTRSHVNIRLDLKPALDAEKLDRRLIRDMNDRGGEELSSILRGLLPKKLIPLCLKETKIKADAIGAEIDAKQRKRIKLFLKEFQITVTNHRPFAEAIITKGGIKTAEVNQKTMESKIVSGLFIAGEILDLDGPTGGYNLQIAFSTANAAAQSISAE